MTVYSRPDVFAAEQAELERGLPLQGGQIAQGGPSTLIEMGEALLELVKSSAVAKGITLPGRQSVYMAPIPADCEQVAVLLTGWTPQPAPEGGTIVCVNFRWSAGVSVIITRCTPAVVAKGSKLPPAPEKMTEAARIASGDAEIMLEVINRMAEVGSELSVVVNPPSGGLQTVELNLQLLATGSF